MDPDNIDPLEPEIVVADHEGSYGRDKIDPLEPEIVVADEVSHEKEPYEPVIDEKDQSARPKRERTLTAKGLEYTLQTKRRRFDQLSRGLEKNIDILLDLIDFHGVKRSEVTEVYKTWVALLDQFIEVNNQHSSLLKVIRTC